MTPAEAAHDRSAALFRSLLSPEELAEWEPRHCLLLQDARGRRYILHGPRAGYFVVEFMDAFVGSDRVASCFRAFSDVPLLPCWDYLAMGYLAIKYGDGLLAGLAGFRRCP